MKITRTDLGIIVIRSTKTRDLVYLAHNGLKIFAVSAAPGRPVKLAINKKFLLYPKKEWRDAVDLYSDWKRQHMALKMPNHSGLCFGGKQHPWRRKVKPSKPVDPHQEELL